jgi:hypothetical protein
VGGALEQGMSFAGGVDDMGMLMSLSNDTIVGSARRRLSCCGLFSSSAINKSFHLLDLLIK